MSEQKGLCVCRGVGRREDSGEIVACYAAGLGESPLGWSRRGSSLDPEERGGEDSWRKEVPGVTL